MPTESTEFPWRNTYGDFQKSSNLSSYFHILNQRIQVLEQRFSEMGYDMKNIVQTDQKRRYTIDPQLQTLYGMYTALCVGTIDPWKQNKVRFFTPLLTDPQEPIKSLDWAWPISSMGGFDDSGLNWPPPAGSTLCLIFQNGARSAPFYLGTTWHRNRGPAGQRNFGYNVEEFYKIHDSQRDGYFVGPNDGSQVFPPWNTESYNGLDIDSIEDFENDTEAQKKITYPNIYGFKTPQKHYFKMVDGNYKCLHRWRRAEWGTALGNWICMKDDFLHPGGEWAHTDCVPGGDASLCNDENESPLDSSECHKKCDVSGLSPTDADLNKGMNPYFKHKSECIPYRGPGTPMNNRCSLPQSGLQFLSRSGHTSVYDDQVEEPTGVPDWKNGQEAFSFGCTDRFLGRLFTKSATGHLFMMSDVEDANGLRTGNYNRPTSDGVGQKECNREFVMGDSTTREFNGIRLLTATGNRIDLNDDTLPSQTAGPRRGIGLETTSRHHLMMIDDGNEQASPKRKDCGIPASQATNAFVRLRSGYGLEIMMHDAFSQESTQQQYIQIFCPQKDNSCGPHIMRFQETTTDCGQIFLRAGGEYVISTCCDMYTVIGSPERPSMKFTHVTDQYIINVEEMYFNKADKHFFLADKYIALLAGEDCISDAGNSPCIYPVVVAKCPKICPLTGFVHWTEESISDRVYASAKPECAS